MDKKKIALIVVVLFLLIGLGSFVFANPDQDNNLEGPGVSEDGGSGDGEVIDGTEPTATPEEENDDSVTETDPITTYGNGGNGTGTGAGNNGTTGGVGNTDMSQYDDARRIIEELENRVNAMQSKDDSNDAVDYRTDTDIIDMVNNLPDGTAKDELKNRLDAINKVLDDTTAPVITGINNNDVTKENVTINVTDDNDVTITATLDGEEIEFTTPLTLEGHYVVTVTDKNFNSTVVEFTIDKTPIALDWLYVLNNSGTDYKVIGDGQKLYVELVFSEEFTSTPMIQIGNAEVVEMSCHWTDWQTEKQYFKCDATITIDGSTMGLENGKEVPVKITNVLDAAENETVLTNENITETEKYGHVIYDKQAPEMEVLRLTNVSRKDENGAWLQVAKAGDIVRVIVQFNENLATLPTLKVNGTEVGVMKYDSNMQSYTYDYKVTENDVNGVMQIEISNYADAAGNVGVTLTNKDINHDTQNQVVIDTVAPEYAAMGIFNWTNDNDGTDRTYATKDEHIRLYVSFPEMLATNPKVDIYGQDGKVTTLELTYSEAAKFYFVEFDTTEEFALSEGKINFKIYGYADEAGNVGVELTQDMTTSKEYPYVIYDSVAPVLNFNNGFITDGFTVEVTDDNFDYMTIQYYDGREMQTITENTFTLDAEGDNVRYNIKAYDKAGNVSAYADIYLDTQDPVLSGTGVNGKNEVKVKDGGYYKNATIHFEDGSLKKVVLVNENGTEEVLEEYKDNYTTAKMAFERAFTEDGTYTIKAIDRKGNETVITFTIDTVKPIITGVENGAITNQNVTLNVTDENPGGTIHLKRNGQIVKNYSFGTPLTEEGNYEVYVSDLAGNVSETIKFTIEKTLPEITVKDEYVGNLEKKVFSNVSFKLYDNTGVSAYKINDGEYKELTINNWSDANFQNIKGELVYGTNTITLRDVAGNEATYTFTYDNVAPTITVKDGYVGDLDKKVFSNVSFSLYDDYEVIAYKINDGEYGQFTANKWSDANFQNIVGRLVYGTNTITLKDVAGNEATYTFTYDNVEPKITVKEGYVGDLEKKVFSNVSFSLYDEYEVVAYKINDGEYGEFTANKWSDANFQNIVGRLVYGTNTITLKDVAGNETTYTFTYDNVEPKITVKEGYVGDLEKKVFSNVSFSLYDEYEVVAYKINDGEYGEFTANNWSDANFQNIVSRLVYGKNTITLKDVAGNEAAYEFTYDNIDNEDLVVTVSKSNNDKSTNQDVVVTLVGNKPISAEGWTQVSDNTIQKVYSEKGKYSVIVTDKNGNQVTVDFEVKRIDKVAPEATVIKSNNDKSTNQDVTVTIIANEAIYKPEGWTEVTTNKEHEFTKVYSEDGKYSVEITDKAGNKSTINFEVKRIDKVAPEATVTMSNNNGQWNTNQDVTVTIVANEAIYKPEGWTEVTTNKEHEFTKVYSENGKYSVEITDKAGNKSTINFEVKRIDKVAPVMTVISPNRYEIEQGSVYVDKGYSAWDAFDKDVTNLVQISYRFIAAGTGNYVSVPEIDTNKIGQYVVTYTAYDKAGNSSQSTRVVEIIPKTEG